MEAKEGESPCITLTRTWADRVYTAIGRTLLLKALIRSLSQFGLHEENVAGLQGMQFHDCPCMHPRKSVNHQQQKRCKVKIATGI